MAGLDRHQPAEAVPQHEDRREAQRAAQGEQQHADPAHRVAVDRPEVKAVGGGGQPAVEQAEDQERRDRPAIAAILAQAAAQIARREQ